MYKLLLVTDREEIQALFRNQIDWSALNCRPPLMAASTHEAVQLLNTTAVDAAGYCLAPGEEEELIRFLRYGKPSLSIYEVSGDVAKQRLVLDELCRMLNRLRADFSDEYYDEEAMLTIQRDEIAHRLLAGQIRDWEAVKRGMRLVRAPLDAEKPCVLYEIEMPHGEVFLSEHQGHAQERLERALRNNFFGRYADGICYSLAVVTPRRIRLCCVPTLREENESREAFASRADNHVRDSIDRIREYLELEMSVVSSRWLESLRELTLPECN